MSLLASYPMVTSDVLCRSGTFDGILPSQFSRNSSFDDRGSGRSRGSSDGGAEARGSHDVRSLSFGSVGDGPGPDGARTSATKPRSDDGRYERKRTTLGSEIPDVVACPDRAYDSSSEALQPAAKRSRLPAQSDDIASSPLKRDSFASPPPKLQRVENFNC
jgi:hypothetical protein